MTTSYTSRLRSFAQRTSNGVAKSAGCSTSMPSGKNPQDQMKKKVRVVNGVTITRYTKRESAKFTQQATDPAKFKNQFTHQLDLEVTPQAKPIAYDDHGFYEVDRIEGFQHPTAEQREAACREQVKTFGQSFLQSKNAKHCKKWDKKQQALDLALSRAFDRRDEKPSDAPLSLDPNRDDDEGQTWIPLSSDPLQDMQEDEQQAWTYKQLEEGLNTLTGPQHMALMERAEGVPVTDRHHLQRAIRKMQSFLAQ